MSGAIEALHILEQHYEVYVLSAVSRENLFMESDKVLWLMKYLGEVYYKQLIRAFDKMYA